MHAAVVQALSNLGADYVRYSPWFMNPRAAVIFTPTLTSSLPFLVSALHITLRFKSAALCAGARAHAKRLHS